METLQKVFFEHIKNKLPANLSLVDSVADILNISNDSAYRRIRGEKPISFEEILILANHFKISVDKVLELKSDMGTFSGKYIHEESFNFEMYMATMQKEFEYMNSFKENEIIYLSKDIPVFHFFAFPEIAAFKYFIWMKTVLNFNNLSNEKFALDYFIEPIHKYGEKVIQQYNKIPGTEIMSIDNINTTLRQIEYFKETYNFKSDIDLNTLYEKLHIVTDHLESQAKLGKKFLPNQKQNENAASYKLYVNDYIIGDNSIMVILNGHKISYQVHSHLNYIIIDEKQHTDYVYHHIQNIIKRSILVSEVGEKYRSRFFHLIHDRIDQCQQNKMELIGKL